MTRNFTGTEIEITFDEYIKLQNEFKETSISPDLEVPPVYKIIQRKKMLQITLPDSLEKNTTYTINLGKALVDFNEGNELNNFSYVFSTGPEIDSLSVSGNVRNALTHEIEKDIAVLLIPTRQDSIFGKRKANIFTRTDSSGNFSLKNLREDTYRIYALKEKNNDRIFNAPEEEIGFIKDSIQLTKDTAGIKLQIFHEEPEKFRLLDRKLDNKGKIMLVFNKTLKNPALTLLNETDLDNEKIVEYTKTVDTAFIWLPRIEFDSLHIAIYDGDEVLDTAKLKRNKKDEYDRSITLTDNISSQRVDKINNILITGSAPIESFDISKIKLTEDSIPRANFQLNLDSVHKRQVRIRYPWKAKREYILELQEGVFTGYFGEKSTAGQRKFAYDETENYGDINLNIIVPDSNKHYVLELLNDKGLVVNKKSVTKSEKVTYKNLPGAKYAVRIVFDENANKKWDTGNVRKRLQPEKVWYWDKIMSIRPNWEQEETITIPEITEDDSQIIKTPIPEEEKDDINTLEEESNLKSVGEIKEIKE